MREEEQAIWSVITGGLGLIEHHALDESAKPGFQEFVRGLVSPALERLGWGAMRTQIRICDASSVVT